MRRSMRKWWSQAAISLSLFALLLQVMLPLGQAVRLARSTAGDGFSLPSIVCTLYGARLVYDASDRVVPPHKGGDIDCPICVAHSIGATALNNASEIVLPAPAQLSLRSEPLTYRVPAGHAAPSRYHSRAPPLAA